MPLIDQIEMLGTAVDEGLIGRDAAAELLAELSEGGLTKLGAAHALANHRGMRKDLEQGIAETRRAIAAMRDVEYASTPEEFLRAHDAMRAEMGRQREASLERNRQRLLRDIRRGRGDLPGGAR